MKYLKFFLQYFFSNILPKFSDFVNSEDCIGKITLEFIRPQPVSIKKNIWSFKKQIFSIEKMRNSGNCVYDYAHSFFGDDF